LLSIRERLSKYLAFLIDKYFLGISQMARNVTFTVTTAPAVLPAGVADGAMLLMQILSTDATPVVVATANVPAPLLTYTFTGIEDGSYIASVTALDSTGAPLGIAVPQPFDVSDLLFNQPVSPIAIVVT
jgi:hypothetical protein